MIVTQNLSKTFRSKEESVHAVQNLNLNIKKGEIVGLFGPNGAGKTTTVRMLSTIFTPTTGGAIVGDYDIINEPLKVRSILGISPETPALYPRLTARRNLKFYASLYDIPKSEQNERIEKLMKQFDLFDAIDREVGAYSKGMKQKLSVIKSIIHDPEVLILDEPWSGLSPSASKDLRNIIGELAHERTILISTHNLAQAEKLVDKFVIIAQGKKLIDATSDELRKKYHVNPMIHVETSKEFDFKSVTDDLEFILTTDIIGNTVDYGVKSVDQTPELVEYLVKEGARIMNVKEIVPSLEEIYIDIVSQNGGDSS